ncbi:MAG: hypothetical protein IT539_13625 [Bradyrhizobiaceae bacterium]|nr:hypothetical protein [Bradyrhizobiaceae bacterium]
MHRGLIRIAVLAPLGLSAGACYGPQHPDYARYEYLYVDGAFQRPYTEFPSGTQRGGWKCYDARVSREFDCTFVRGGWDQYQFIYRPRR